ncbi:MAG: AAA family ATPase [Chloroflexota bacterium]
MNNLNDVDFLKFVGKQESQFLEPVSTFRDEIHDVFENGTEQEGDTLPWRKTEDYFRLRPNEVTLWAGINGHGKSLLTSHVFAHLMKTSRCLIASLEMPIKRSGKRLLKQIAGTPNPTKAFRDMMIDWTNDRLWFYDQLDTVKTERIIGMCIYAFTELNIDHIIIDSLMKCGIPNKDTEKMQLFIDRLMWVAKTHGGHIHLVHHVRKGENEDNIPNKFDVKGAGEITDMVDNVCLVWKNKKKERMVENGDTVEKMIPDGLVIVEKQRHGEWEGRINLWFDKPSNQFKGSPDGKLEWFEIKPQEKVA